MKAQWEHCWACFHRSTNPNKLLSTRTHLELACQMWMSTQQDSRAAQICTAEQLSLYPHVANMWRRICLKIFLSPSLLQLIPWVVWLDSELCLREPVRVTASPSTGEEGMTLSAGNLFSWIFWRWNHCLLGLWGQAWDSCKMSCYILCCWALPVPVRRAFQAHLCLSLAPLDCTPSLALSFVKSQNKSSCVHL